MEKEDFLIRILNSRGVSLRKASNREIVYQPDKIIVEKFSSVHKGDIMVDSVFISLQHQRLCISHFSKEHTSFPLDDEFCFEDGENFQITKKGYRNLSGAVESIALCSKRRSGCFE